MKLWRKDLKDDIYKLNPLNDSMIKDAEELLNVELPLAYIDVLREQNGGYIEYNAIPYPLNDNVEDNPIDITHILGIGHDTGILDSPKLIVEWGLPKNIVLFSGDGHSWFAFDYRYEKKDPPIIWLNNDSNSLLTIATSFTYFLNLLYTEEVIEPDSGGTVKVSKEGLLHAIKENNIADIIESIDLLPFQIDDRSMKWFSEVLLNLSNHPNNEVRKSVSQSTFSLIHMLEIETLSVLGNKFKDDINMDVRYFGTIINEALV